jgi:hypothetical protein
MSVACRDEGDVQVAGSRSPRTVPGVRRGDGG